MITEEISQAGTSIWLDDLSRGKITGTDSHSLPQRIACNNVVGVTTNPSIFNAAISQGVEYAESIAEHKDKGAEEVVRLLTTDDVRSACDVFAAIFESSKGIDGRVSIEVDPRLARDTQRSIDQGLELWKMVDRPNVMIKIPATLQGLPAITALLAEGISVNATLIFSVERYLQVFDAFTQGLEARRKAKKPIDKVTSVASLFVSRVDSAVDSLLKTINSENSNALLGKAAIANAILTYEAFDARRHSSAWQSLEADGARIQRPLWASTGVKDSSYPDTRYVLDLVAQDTVNTMPQATLDAVIDHGTFGSADLSLQYAPSHLIFDQLAALDIAMESVTKDLENDGVKKFEAAWTDLLKNVAKTIAQ